MSTAPFSIVDTEQKQLSRATETIGRMYNWFRPYQNRYDELYRHYVGYAPPRFFPDQKTPRSNVFAPYPFANVEQVRATITEALFAPDPPFECLPRGSNDSDAALAMQKVLEIKALQEARLRRVVHEYVGGLGVYGTYGLYVGWDWDHDTIKTMQWGTITPDANTPPEMIGNHPETGDPLVLHPATGMPLQMRQPQTQKVPRNRPLYENIDIYDLLIDPDGAFVARMFDKTLAQMLREQENAKAAGQTLYTDDALARLQTHVGSRENGFKETIHIAELWDVVNSTYVLLTLEDDLTALSFKDKRFANRSASYSSYRRATANAPRLLLCPETSNPFLHCKVPILWTNYTKLPGEPRGFGVIEPTYQMVERTNDMLRLIEDNWRMGVNQRYAINMERDIDLEGLQLANVPGGIVPVYGDPNQVMKELPTHTPTSGDYAIIPLYKQITEAASGIADFYARGVGSPVGNETATGIQSVMAQASKRLVEVVQVMEEDIIEPLLQMTASNIQQFITDDIEVRITDDQPHISKINSNFVTITPADLMGAFNFRLMGALYMENRIVQQTNALKLAEVVGMNPTLAAYAKPYESLQELYRLFRIPYPGRFLLSPEEVHAQQQAQQQEQLAQMMVMKQLGLDGSESKPPKPPQVTETTTSRGKGGTVKKTQRSYADPGSNPITSATRQAGQQAGANSSGSAMMPGQGAQ